MHIGKCEIPTGKIPLAKFIVFLWSQLVFIFRSHTARQHRQRICLGNAEFRRIVKTADHRGTPQVASWHIPDDIKLDTSRVISISQVKRDRTRTDFVTFELARDRLRQDRNTRRQWLGIDQIRAMLIRQIRGIRTPDVDRHLATFAHRHLSKWTAEDRIWSM